MKFIVTISNENDVKNWNSNLLKTSSATAYQTINWSSIYQEKFNSKPVYVVVQNSKKEIVGQLSALIHNEYVWRDSNYLSKKILNSLNLGSYLYWHYGPIIHDNKYYDEIVSLIITAITEFAKENDISLIRGSLPPLGKTPKKKIFKQMGYEIKNWKTYIVDLRKNIDALYNNLDKKTRYDIRKIKDVPLRFEFVSDKNSLTDYAKLAVETRKSKGERRKLDPTFLDSVWKNMYQHNLLYVSLAKKNKKTLGGIWNISFNGNIVQQGVETSSKSKFTGTFLTWKTITKLLDSGNVTYDMGGANPNPQSRKEKQIDFYKSKWGGKETSYFIITKKIKGKRIKISSILANPKKATSKIKKYFKN